MNCSAVMALLEELITDDLDSASAAGVRTHLQSCRVCHGEETGLREMIDALRTLPESIEPDHDLWPGIDAGRPAAAALAPTWWGMAAAILAAALLVIGTLSTWALLDVPETVAPGAGLTVTATPPAAAIPASLVGTGIEAAELSLLQAKDELRAALAEQRSGLAPGTLDTVEKSLAVIDGAIAEIHASLSRDPGNRDLTSMLMTAHLRQVDLLQRVTASASHLRKTAR